MLKTLSVAQVTVDEKVHSEPKERRMLAADALPLKLLAAELIIPPANPTLQLSDPSKYGYSKYG
jgi:hypothetical protein